MTDNLEDVETEKGRQNRKRGCVVNLVLVIASICFAFIIGEILLRLTYAPQVPTIPHRLYHHTRPTDSPYRWTSVHDEFDTSISFNSLALRGSEPDLSREHVWLFMGDSMIEGLQVPEEETMTSYLQEKLGKNHTVLNTGVGGYSPILMFLRLEDLLKRISPTIPEKIFFGLFPNDLEEEYLYRLAAYKDTKGKIISVTPGVMRGPIGRFRTSLFQYSMIFQMVQRTFLRGNPEEQQTEVDPYFPSERVIYPFRPQWTDAEKQVWSQVFRSIGEIQRFCKSKGIEIILVIIPPGHQISPDVWKTGKQAMSFSPDFHVENTTFQDEITRRAGRIGVQTIDLLPDFKAHPSPEELYFDFDGHWTAKGNEFAAEVILKKLEEADADEESP